MREKSTLFIVVPCYNEKDVLPETSKRLSEVLENMISKNKITDESRIIFVDDGSLDNTWEIICREHNTRPRVSGIKLSRNQGHQNALLGGLMTVKDECGCAVSIDADLQDDINTIEDMVDKYLEGCEIVYGVRKKRDSDTFFKRTTAVGFYKLMRFMGVDCVFNHADYRLLSRQALNALAEFPEKNLFLRGMIPLIGFKSDCVYYDRKERFAGESKYPLKKMLSFAFDGITSFSINPIRMISTMGITVCFIAFLILLYSVIRKFTGHTITGWTSIICSLWFLGGVQLIGIGLIGEYIGKMYKEVKNRPRYIIETYLK
ncbi:MAG: glycosyltransferase family 2 protein [Clostridia bacterium]|nr:glycosyltransferase family 2 protein [Clostridia bacterium]